MKHHGTGTEETCTQRGDYPKGPGRPDSNEKTAEKETPAAQAVAAPQARRHVTGRQADRAAPAVWPGADLHSPQPRQGNCLLRIRGDQPTEPQHLPRPDPWRPAL